MDKSLNNSELVNNLSQEQIKDLKTENETLKQRLEIVERYNLELSETNQHLISATWRERKIKDELQESKQIIEKQNKSITESINYSWKIQKTLLPPLEDVKKDFIESIFIYKPKDVVSGDFPWYYKLDDVVYFASVDCTGHGVPGAMLSVIGYLTLNHIVKKNKSISPAEILDELCNEITNTLRQSEGYNKTDGMELALCKLNLKTNELEFAGARRPLIYFKGKELNVVNGDKSPIGGNAYKYDQSFTNHKIQLAEGDAIFVFSDGITDQLGGEINNETTFSRKRVRKILCDNIDKRLIDLKFELETQLSDWQTHSQTDDMLLLGVRI